MSMYRRARSAGGTYFFTVVTHRRQPILCDLVVRGALRQAVTSVQLVKPFVIDGWVLLPDHLHCVWTLPPGDDDFPIRWALIKRYVSTSLPSVYRDGAGLSFSNLKHRESGIWQRRFSEHRVRDEGDFGRHLDYLHFNPVKHGLVATVDDWRFSSFHRYVRLGLYPPDWTGSGSELNEVEP